MRSWSGWQSPRRGSRRLQARGAPWLVLAAWVLVGAVRCTTLEAQDAPERRLDPRCTIHNQLYGVELVRMTPCCPGELALLVDSSGEVAEYTVSSSLRKVESIRLRATKLVVTGNLRAGGRGLIVADLASGSFDEIWSSSYQLSPSGRFVAYVSFVDPEVTPLERRRSVLLLYDLDRSAADNRVGQPETLSAGNAGIPIFPKRNAAAQSYDSLLEPAHRFLSPLLWSSDDRSLVFLVGVGQRLSLVRADLDPAGRPRDIRTRSLSATEVFGDGALSAGVRPAALSLAWRDPSHVAVSRVDRRGLPHTRLLQMPE